MIVGNVVVEDAVGVVLVPDDDVVEAVPAEGTASVITQKRPYKIASKPAI